MLCQVFSCNLWQKVLASSSCACCRQSVFITGSIRRWHILCATLGKRHTCKDTVRCIFVMLVLESQQSHVLYHKHLQCEYIDCACQNVRPACRGEMRFVLESKWTRARCGKFMRCSTAIFLLQAVINNCISPWATAVCANYCHSVTAGCARRLFDL